MELATPHRKNLFVFPHETRTTSQVLEMGSINAAKSTFCNIGDI
jgi:hypothetical protein